MTPDRILSISRETGITVLRKFLTEPKKTVRETAAVFQEENPDLFGCSLTGAFWFMQGMGPREALTYLRGNLYFYESYREEAQRQNLPLTRVNSTTIANLNLRHQEIENRANLRAANLVAEASIKGFVILERSENSGISPYFISVLEAGMYLAHQALTEQLNTKDEAPEDPDVLAPPIPSFLVPVGKTAVRATLVEIILDPDEFITATREKLKKHSPDWVENIGQEGYSDIFRQIEYLLFTSLILDAYFREFAQRNLPFPVVTLDTIQGFDQSIGPDGSKIVILADDRIAQNEQALQQLREDDSRLYNAYQVLKAGRRIGEDDKFRLDAANFAVANAYKKLRRQMETNYWERQMT